MDSIELLEFLMENHGLTMTDMAGILNQDESIVIEILNYKRHLSGNDANNLASHFKMRKEAFNAAYVLK